MQDNVGNTIFMKILPVLLTGAIVWMISSINTVQVDSVRMVELLNKNQQMIDENAKTSESHEKQIVDLTISLALLQADMEDFAKNFERHIEKHGCADNVRQN